MIDEAAPPVDLNLIVQEGQARSPFLARRVVAYAALASTLIAVTAALALISRGSDGSFEADPTTPTAGQVSPDDDGSPTTTDVIPGIEDSVPLVYRSQWPDAVLAPMLGLPACESDSHVQAFISAEYPDVAAADPAPISVFDLAALVPVPRFGALSVFSTDLLEGSCLETAQMGDATGWALMAGDGIVMLQAASQVFESNSVPDDVIAANYHQSRIASGQGFNASVDADGRTWGLVAHNYFVLAAHEFLPGGDVHFAGERLAASLWIRPSIEDDPRYTGRPADTFDPTGLPEGYGLCEGPWLAFELSPESAEWQRTIFCDRHGDYIELLVGFSEGLPVVPADSEVVAFGTVAGSAWEADGRLNVAVDAIANIPRYKNYWLWISGPADLDTMTLRSVLLSTFILRPQVQNARKAGDGVLPDGIAYQTTLAAIAAQDGLGIEARVSTFADQGDPLTAEAFALQANRFEPGESLDLLILDRGDRVQAIAACGGLIFNARFNPTDPDQHNNLSWSLEDDRYGTIIGWLDLFFREIGCDPDSGVIPQEVLDYWALDGTLESVGDEPGWLCPVKGPFGYSSDLDFANVPADLKRELSNREPIRVGSGDSGPECQQPHLLVLLDLPDATLAATSAGMTVWPQIARPEDVCPPESCSFDGPIIDLTLNGEPARLQTISDAATSMIWWVDSSGTPMYAESSSLSEDRVVEIIRAIDVDPRTHRATVAAEALGSLGVVSDQASVGIWVRKLSASATYVIDGVNVGVSLDYDWVFDPIAEFAPSTTLELVTVNEVAAIWIPAHGNFLMYTDRPGIRVTMHGSPTVDQAVTIAEQLTP